MRLCAVDGAVAEDAMICNSCVSCFAVLLSSKEAGEILDGVQLSITDALSSVAHNAN